MNEHVIRMCVSRNIIYIGRPGRGVMPEETHIIAATSRITPVFERRPMLPIWLIYLIFSYFYPPPVNNRWPLACQC